MGGTILKLGLVLVVLGAGAFFGRDTEFAQRLKGDGYDYDVLPMQVYPRPDIVRADMTDQFFSVGQVDGVATATELRLNSTVNVTTQDATIEVVNTFSPVVDGVIGVASGRTTQSGVVMDDFSYSSPDVPEGPWERRPQSVTTQLGLGAGAVMMYQDVVDASLRTLRPETVVSERRGLVDVTTYTFRFPFGEFYESAPALYERVSRFDGNATPESPVEVIMSVDADGVVWLLDVSLAMTDVIAHATAQANTSAVYPYRMVYELRSVSGQPAAITPPANFVDAPAPTATGEV